MQRRVVAVIRKSGELEADGGLLHFDPISGAQRPFDQGVVEAMLAGYGLLDKKAPGYVVIPAVPVTRTNLLEGWRTVYHQDPPLAISNNLPGAGLVRH